VPDAGSLGDYIMMNEYGGSWWDLPTGRIHAYLDSIHMSYPDKTFFISEFGLCEPNFKGGDERRIVDLAYHMAIYETKPFVQGAIYFDLTDTGPIIQGPRSWKIQTPCPWHLRHVWESQTIYENTAGTNLPNRSAATEQERQWETECYHFRQYWPSPAHHKGLQIIRVR